MHYPKVHFCGLRKKTDSKRDANQLVRRALGKKKRHYEGFEEKSIEGITQIVKLTSICLEGPMKKFKSK